MNETVKKFNPPKHIVWLLSALLLLFLPQLALAADTAPTATPVAATEAAPGPVTNPAQSAATTPAPTSSAPEATVPQPVDTPSTPVNSTGGGTTPADSSAVTPAPEPATPNPVAPAGGDTTTPPPTDSNAVAPTPEPATPADADTTAPADPAASLAETATPPVLLADLTPFERLKAAIAAATTDGSATDVNVAGDIAFTEGLTIDGGRQIVLKNEAGQSARFIWADGAPQGISMITIAEDAGLTLDGEQNDSLVFDGEGKNRRLNSHHGAFIDSRGSLTINHATFRGMNVDNATGVAPIRAAGANANVTMNDGLISENASGQSTYYSAGAIYLTDHAKMTMNGGTIEKNKAGAFPYPSFLDNWWADQFGVGGIRVQIGSELIMNGGTIEKNLGGTGGILVGDGNPYSYNRQQTNPDKLPVIPIADFEFNGGSISENLGAGMAGGVSIFGAGNMVMNGGSISDNKGFGAGGVLAMDWYVDGVQGPSQTRAKTPIDRWSALYPAGFIMYDGRVTGNTGYSTGGGINVSTNKAELYGGLIADNQSGNQGGGVYVTAVPYVLRVYDAYISGNTADDSMWIKSEGVMEDNGSGQFVPYKLHLGAGGGIWFCPTGNAEIYVEDGVAIFGNNATKVGDDFHSEDKVPGYYTVTLPMRTASGVRILWYEDAEGNRYDPANPKEMEILNGISEPISLKAILDNGGEVELKDLYKLIVTGNRSNKGGGFGSNGSIIFGKKPTSDNPLKALKVKKVWENVPETKLPESLVLWLTIDGRKAEQIVLNKDNDWQAIVKNLPATVNGKPVESLIGFIEETPGDWTLSTGAITFVDGFGDKVAVSPVLYMTVTLTNKGKTPPPTPGDSDKTLLIKKVWDGNGERPETIQVKITVGDATAQTLTLSAANNWQAAWTVPATASASTIRVEEVQVPGWNSVVGRVQTTSDLIFEVLITNRQTPPVTPPDEPSKPPVTPPDEPTKPPVTPPDEPAKPPVTPPDEPAKPPVTPPVVPPEKPAKPPTVMTQSIPPQGGKGIPKTGAPLLPLAPLAFLGIGAALLGRGNRKK